MPALLEARAQAAAGGSVAKDTSVVWLWLAGGPTHIETFDPKMDAPAEFRSTTGEVKSKVPGITLGGNFSRMASVADRMAFVRSFAHNDSGHGSGTHYVMTGYSNRNIDNGGLPSRPSVGSICAKSRGANNAQTGMPTYVRLGGIGSDGPAFLGKAYSPFESSGESKRDMDLRTPLERIDDRRALLTDLDRFQRKADQTGLMDGLTAFEQQAFSLVLGNAPQAFDLKDENPQVLQRYGKKTLAQQLLVARRLCEAGCGFVTVSYGGWDMHSQVARSMNQRGPEVDQAVAAFLEDVADRGLSEKILLVITGEFGRTPKVNRNAGRDHWGPLCTLALAGGGLRMGQTVGASDARAYRPASDPITPQDLMATVFQVLGIDTTTQFVNQAGRPVYMIEDGKPIAELV
ncbi:MAG: DUF1501 domain-containing protein [Planctomycetaceae bacterium]|nr:DUF1501 domain-containing protein [Planctomycetaceae bacterium]